MRESLYFSKITATGMTEMGATVFENRILFLSLGASTASPLEVGWVGGNLITRVSMADGIIKPKAM